MLLCFRLIVKATRCGLDTLKLLPGVTSPPPEPHFTPKDFKLGNMSSTLRISPELVCKIIFLVTELLHSNDDLLETKRHSFLRGASLVSKDWQYPAQLALWRRALFHSQVAPVAADYFSQSGATMRGLASQQVVFYGSEWIPGPLEIEDIPSHAHLVLTAANKITSLYIQGTSKFDVKLLEEESLTSEVVTMGTQKTKPMCMKI